jgi:hypothetical protein
LFKNWEKLAERMKEDFPVLVRAALKAPPDDPYRAALERIAAALEKIANG